MYAKFSSRKLITLISGLNNESIEISVVKLLKNGTNNVFAYSVEVNGKREGGLFGSNSDATVFAWNVQENIASDIKNKTSIAKKTCIEIDGMEIDNAKFGTAYYNECRYVLAYFRINGESYSYKEKLINGAIETFYTHHANLLISNDGQKLNRMLVSIGKARSFIADLNEYITRKHLS